LCRDEWSRAQKSVWKRKAEKKTGGGVHYQRVKREEKIGEGKKNSEKGEGGGRVKHGQGQCSDNQKRGS